MRRLIRALPVRVEAAIVLIAAFGLFVLSSLLAALNPIYQGGGAVISILPMGLIFAWFYARTGRLWPLVIGHALFDVIALSQYVK